MYDTRIVIIKYWPHLEELNVSGHSHISAGALRVALLDLERLRILHYERVVSIHYHAWGAELYWQHL